MDVREFLDQVYLGNPLWRWGVFALIVVAAMLALRVIRGILMRRLRRFADQTETDLDDLVEDLVARTNTVPMFLIALYAGSLTLELPPTATSILRTLAIFGALVQVALWANDLLAFAVRHFVHSEQRSEAANQSAADIITFVGRLVLWSIVLLLALDNIPGVEITSLVAGLGVTGIAVALAVQNILGDLFGSLSILLDQPFVVGDFIVVDDMMGDVEHIGLKTTRIRSLFGEELVIANSDLLTARIRNYKKMQERRVVFNLGVAYETPPDKLARIPDIIREAIEAQPSTRFDRSHFNQFGDFSLNFESVYYMLDPDYNVYMDVQQAINLEIFRRFDDEGIVFAYPTQTVYVSSVGDNGQEREPNAFGGASRSR